MAGRGAYLYPELAVRPADLHPDNRRDACFRHGAPSTVGATNKIESGFRYMLETRAWAQPPTPSRHVESASCIIDPDLLGATQRSPTEPTSYRGDIGPRELNA